MDFWMQQFEKLTRKTSESDTKRHIDQITRYIDKDENQFITYSMTVKKQDPIGNVKSFYYPNVGIYTRPVSHKEIVVDPEDGYAKRVVVKGYDGIENHYSIPFNDKNIDALIKWTDGKTQFSIKKEDHRSGGRFGIRDLASWRAKEWKYLLRFGHFPITEYERKIYEDELQGKFVTYPPVGNTGQYR
jgi:hypothetical protein